MPKFVPYIRNQDGSIERISDAIFESYHGEMKPYLFEEQLIGWPEPKVFWAKAGGPSVGIAPLRYLLLVTPQQTTNKP